jgi:tetratricopeptide (TPR) repeat protein
VIAFSPDGFMAVVVSVAVVLLAGLALFLWLAFGRGPRRRRAYGRARKLLHQGDWSRALALAESLGKEPGHSDLWQGRLRNLLGESHHHAADVLLKEKRYDESLQHYVTAAPLLAVDEADLRARVIDAMLAEARRLFAAGTGREATEAVLALLDHTLALQSPCPEASFWKGICHVRLGETAFAFTELTGAYELVGRQFIDPAFYLGAILHQIGRSQEALRYLGEANRVDAGCPFVTWQMGVTLVASGGDSGLALRALQRALGPRGLGLWAAAPERAWVEAFPEGKSYVRRLATKYPYVCPVLGGDLAAIIRQGQMALAQAHYRQGNFQEATDLYTKLLQECPPTVPLLRGLGLSLARLQRYDQAYKHLRIALEEENPKDPLTAGYLALCGAMGKPTNEEDKPKNVTWAIRLLAKFQTPGNAEWAGLIGRVFAEARALNMPLAVEDQELLCDTLASVHAADPPAADAYLHLFRTFPDAVKPIHAWLYARAASTHNVQADGDLELFARTFRDVGPARDFFAHRGWNLDDLEFTYLERSAAQSPGRFPEPLGPDYPARGEAFLLERSRREEEAGRKDAALASVAVLLRLAPQSLAGHDRLACLHYRRGDLDGAAALLNGWHRLAPSDPWPLVRQAVIEEQRGNAEARAAAIDRALGLTRGRTRAAVAYLGARLALRGSVRAWKSESVDGKSAGSGENGKAEPTALPHSHASTPPLSESLTLLQECLKDDPGHAEALWCLAAVRSVTGDREGLAAQAAAMDRPEVADARFHYLGAVCKLAARDYPRAMELARRAAQDESLATESQYLMAWAHLYLREDDAARQALQRVAAAEKSPSAPFARALLGHLGFTRGAYDDAIKWWNQVDARRRAEWTLDEPLRQTVLLSGLLAFRKGRYEQAADRFREAGRLGLRDRRLGSLLTLALVKAGQRLLYGEVK